MCCHTKEALRDRQVGGEKFRLAQYLKLFLANLGEAVEALQSLSPIAAIAVAYNLYSS